MEAYGMRTPEMSGRSLLSARSGSDAHSLGSSHEDIEPPDVQIEPDNIVDDGGNADRTTLEYVS